MTDEDLIEGLRKNALWVTTHDAADRIEQLVHEASLHETTFRMIGTVCDQALQQRDEADAKLAKAVEFIKEVRRHGDFGTGLASMAIAVLAELEEAG